MMNGTVWRIETIWKGRENPVSERRKFSDYEKKTVYARGNGRCAICGKPLEYEKMTIDHKNPLSKGGTNAFPNLQPACLRCNQMKGDFSQKEFIAQIKLILRNWNRMKLEKFLQKR